eukprot:892651-Prymnesium_polylepis.1
MPAAACRRRRFETQRQLRPGCGCVLRRGLGVADCARRLRAAACCGDGIMLPPCTAAPTRPILLWGDERGRPHATPPHAAPPHAGVPRSPNGPLDAPEGSSGPAGNAPGVAGVVHLERPPPPKLAWP